MSWELIALGRFVCGCTLFCLGLLLMHLSDVGRNRTKLVYGVLLTFSGSIILLGFPWPR